MHRIIKSHLENFSNSFGISDLEEAEQFEYFVNYSILTPKISTTFELGDVTTSDSDDGIDGVAVIVDEDLVISDDDAKTIFKSDRKNHDVELVFIQAKRSESFDLGDFLKFKESIIKFVDSEEYEPNDEVQANANAAYTVCLKNVPKIRGGKPSISVRYATTGVYQEPEALEKARKAFEKELKSIGYFSSIDIRFIGRDELTSLWVSTYSSIQAELPIFSNAPLPKIVFKPNCRSLVMLHYLKSLGSKRHIWLWQVRKISSRTFLPMKMETCGLRCSKKTFARFWVQRIQ